MSNSNFASPVGGNQYFTGVQQPSVPPHDQSPIRVLDVNVVLSAGVAENALISLESSGLPYGCIITHVSLNANGSIPSATTQFQAGFAYPDAAQPNVPLVNKFTGVGTAKEAGTQPGVPGVNVNGGFVQTGLSVPVVVPETGKLPQFPVVKVTVAAIPPTPGAKLNVKIGYICP